MPQMKELITEAKCDNLHQVLSFVDSFLESLNCPLNIQMQIDLAVEEAFVNVASYAYLGKEDMKGESGSVTVRVDATEGEKGIIVILIDQGIPFNPLAKADPDITLPAQKRRIGGLGIFLVKNTMSEVDYEFSDGCNILTMKRTW